MGRRSRWAFLGLWIFGITAYAVGAMIGDPFPVWPDGPPKYTPAEQLALDVGEVLMTSGMIAVLLAVVITGVWILVELVRFFRRPADQP